MLDKSDALELLAPLLLTMPLWPQNALELYNTKFSDDEKADLGPIHRAMFINRMTLAEMRRDPAVTGNFSPVQLKSLDMLLLEGEDSTNVSISFNKAEWWWNSKRTRLKTSSNNDTVQAADRRSGQLNFGNIRTIPLVCFYILDSNLNPFNVKFESVGIGLELGSEFDWIHTFREDGSAGVAIQPQLPLIPMPTVKLKKPKAAPPATKVGTRVEEKKKDQRDGGDRRASKGA